MTSDVDPPSLYEIKDLTRDWGLVGEESTVLTVYLSFFGGGFILMSGLSSSGKNGVVDAAAYCTPGGNSRENTAEDADWTFPIPTSVSKTVLFEQHGELNSCPVHIHQDIASLQGEQHLEKMWKRHGEGKSITHSWNQVMGQEREQRSQTIHPPNCMVLFLAEDNQQVDLNDYPEVRNRALVLPVDDSEELTEKVNERQAKLEAGQISLKVNSDRAQQIREYADTVPMHTFGDEGCGGFINPTAVAIDNQNPLPQHFPEARRDFPRLMDFMRTVALFHHADRMQIPSGEFQPPGENNILTMAVTPTDAWLAMRIFGEKMVLSALNLRDKDFELLSILRDDMGETYTATDLMMSMRERGYNITDTDVRSSMDNMLYKGYIRKHTDGSRVEYSASPFAQEARRSVQMDWPEIIEDTRETVHDVLPDDRAEEYEENHLEGEGLLVTHPFSGETVNLEEQSANELEEAVEEREEQESEQAFGGDALSESDDESEAEPEDELQGTLT